MQASGPGGGAEAVGLGPCEGSKGQLGHQAVRFQVIHLDLKNQVMLMLMNIVYRTGLHLEWPLIFR